MGIFDGLLNIFKNLNTATPPTPPAPAATHQRKPRQPQRKTHTPSAPASTHQTGNAAGHSTYRMVPQYQPVKSQVQSPAKPAAASSNTGAANWFNGIGTASASKQTNNLTVASRKGTPLHLTASDCKASSEEKTVYAIPEKPNVLIKIYNDELLNMFKNSNTIIPPTPPALAATHQTGNAAGRPSYRMAPHYQPVQSQVQSPAKPAAASSNIGAANWFNGIGTESASKQTDGLTVYSLKGTPLHLTVSDCKASGGEGTVYAIPEKPNVLVKIYKNDLLQNPAKRAEIEQRIYDMLDINKNKDIDLASFAWPRAVVCNSRGQMIGFAMNRCRGTSFQAFSGFKSIQKCFPKWTRRELALVAIDFLTKLQYLTLKKILVNDFNPANFLVDQKGNVSFIDCDSYQIPGKGTSTNITKTYFASHVAPELLENPKLLAQPRNIHHVEFGAALTIYNILMCGLHPYSYFDPSKQSACGTPDENLRKGRCPLGTGAHCMFPRGNWYNLWSYLTFNLKSSFIHTFQDGHKDPSKRATLDDLQANLQELLIIMEKDPVRLDLNPVKAKRQTRSSSVCQSFSMDF